MAYQPPSTSCSKNVSTSASSLSRHVSLKGKGWLQVAQSLTKKPVKGMLTGPVTVLNWSFPRQDVSRSTTAFQLARALREEVADLEKAGCSIIQVRCKIVTLTSCMTTAPPCEGATLGCVAAGGLSLIHI